MYLAKIIKVSDSQFVIKIGCFFYIVIALFVSKQVIDVNIFNSVNIFYSTMALSPADLIFS